ncbi:MAG TPA: hypothetical protein VHO01_11460, partial [Jatrophihabitans sp.]|nr:hypothetical protein [Jatrophihabitans sp.]
MALAALALTRAWLGLARDAGLWLLLHRLDGATALDLGYLSAGILLLMLSRRSGVDTRSGRLRLGGADTQPGSQREREAGRGDRAADRDRER